MRRATVAAVLVVIAAAGPALAVTPGKDLFIPSVGRLKGACTKGVCAQFRTDVWVYGAANESAEVTIAFLKRDTDNTTPAATHTLTVGPRVTVELADLFDTVFHLDSVAGALRVTATADVAVTARVYDVNVQTNIGTGTAGQFYEGVPGELAIGPGDSTTLIGLGEQSGTWRSNLALVETTGRTFCVNLDRIDGDGNTLFSHVNYCLQPFEAKQISRVLQFLGGSGTMTNQRVRVSTPFNSPDTGRVLIAASRIDSRTGDPFTIEMVGEPIAAVADRTIGRFLGSVLSQDGSVIDGMISFEVEPRGITGFRGMVAVPCGEESFVLDFDIVYSDPVGLFDGGGFNVSGATSYSDGQGGTFTAIWVLGGLITTEGLISQYPSLISRVSGAGGDYTACNGEVYRAWTGGWVGSSTP